MAESVSITVDSKGRLLVPRKFREALNIEPGDTFFVECEQNGTVLRFAKAENPFDLLARHAEREYGAGRTLNIEEFAAARDIVLDTDAD